MTVSPSPNSMITKEERTVLERIAVTAKAPHSQRALCILAVDSGMSQKKAAEKSGLTPGQAKYWLKKFWSKSLDIFPEQVRNMNGAGVAAPNTETAPAAPNIDLVVEELATSTKEKAKKKKKKKKQQKDTKGKRDKGKKKKKKKKKKK